MYFHMCGMCIHLQNVCNEYDDSMYMHYNMPVSVYVYLSVHLLLHICPVSVSSQVFTGLVLRLCGSEIILQERLQVLKSVPLIRLSPPALQHQFME